MVRMVRVPKVTADSYQRAIEMNYLPELTIISANSIGR